MHISIPLTDGTEITVINSDISELIEGDNDRLVMHDGTIYTIDFTRVDDSLAAYLENLIDCE